jgi:diamine N-acetyltransferase
MTKHTIIRRATAEDAETLAYLGQETFRESFGHLYTPENLQRFLAESHSAQIKEQEINDERNLVLIAEHGDTPVGYAKARPCELPVPNMPQNAYELQRLYLLQAYTGQGTGSALMEECMLFFRERKASAVYLSVYSGNAGAQRLYAKRGFHKVGDYHFMVGEHADDEWILQLRNWSVQS